jgi:hypothetical protein
MLHSTQLTIKQGLGFTRIQWRSNIYTLVREGFPISPQFYAHPILTKNNMPKFVRLWCKFGYTIHFFKPTRKILSTCQSFQVVREIISNLSSTF